MKKVWFEKAWDQFCDVLQSNMRMAKRIQALLQSIERNGYNCIGKPEPLKGDLAGKWSVRIDEKNRIVFSIEDGSLVIYSCTGHYE